MLPRPGNLKLDAPPPQADMAALQKLTGAIKPRPVWLAASTHPGEEEMLAACHSLLRETHADILTLIVPRHPERGDKIAAALRADSYAVAQRSKGEAINAASDIYLMDTLGEMGLAYRLAEMFLSVAL